MNIEIQFQSLIEIEFLGDGLVRGEGLTTENVETDCAAEGVADQGDATGEGWVAGEEEVVYSIHFAGYGADYTFSELGSVVQQYIQ
jgi:hypothetical protein